MCDMVASQSIIPVERIASRIYLIRGEKVMLDADLAELYGVETRTLVQAVKRNIDRFPPDFMFQLSEKEHQNLRSQIVISSWGGRRYPPYAFTEHGVAMLSSVLKSKKAVHVSIAIVRTFVQMRNLLATHAALARKVEQLDHSVTGLYDIVRKLLDPGPSKNKPIGYIWHDE
jgi:phage regulator Rha-like protein